MKTTKSKIQHSKTLFLLTFIISLTSVSFAAEEIWIKKADMPTARFLFATSVVDGKIYAIGGAPRPYEYYSVVEEYDPVTNKWIRKTDMPTARVGLSTSVVNGKIYAIGGGNPAIRTVEEYDPRTDSWMRKADMPTARGFHSTSVVDGKIYAIGGAGTTSGPAFRTVEEYDPATNTWTRRANLPEPRYLHAASVVDGKIYIIAGSWQEYTSTRAVYAYDPATDAWERKADAPTARAWTSASTVDGRIYVIGGDFGSPKPNVEEYDPAIDTWTRRADMPIPRGSLCTSAFNGKIYVIGGITTSFYDPLSTVEEYYPNQIIVDFNGDGIINTKEILRLIESWGQDDPMCDIAPRPSGDGIVDALDLELLMSYWGQPVDDPLLLSHWTLDETEGMTAYDSAGVNDAYIIGDPIWQPAGGIVDGAIQLDGIDGCAVAGSALNPADGPFSVFVWINGGLPGQVVMSQQGAADWLMVNADGALMTELKAMGRSGNPLQSQTVITDGLWHRIGFVWDGLNRAIYVDDILVAEDTQDTLESSNGGLYLGTSKLMTPGTYWFGLIDDIRIYNRAVYP